jgi:hypothetical protein
MCLNSCSLLIKHLDRGRNHQAIHKVTQWPNQTLHLVERDNYHASEQHPQIWSGAGHE